MVANRNAMRSAGIAAAMVISFTFAAGCAPKKEASAPLPQSSTVAPAAQASPTGTTPPANGAMTDAQVQQSDEASAKLKLSP
ncbi:MAG: hypothetical protein H7Y38_16100 [Armatimonadetes bacterium]|nr:hypothetical protein [Armatimonadota bacterium]